MTLQEARKVIGLNIHNLNGSMQMAVATIMDALEDMMKDDAVPADETPEYQEGYSEGRKDAFEEFELQEGRKIQAIKKVLANRRRHLAEAIEACKEELFQRCRLEGKDCGYSDAEDLLNSKTESILIEL